MTEPFARIVVQPPNSPKNTFKARVRYRVRQQDRMREFEATTRKGVVARTLSLLRKNGHGGKHAIVTLEDGSEFGTPIPKIKETPSRRWI